MHTKLKRSDKLAILALIGIFTAGVTLGSLLTAAAMRKEPDVIITTCGAETQKAEPSADETTDKPTVEETPDEPELTNLGEFKVTAYCTCSKCCGAWADGITYTGTQATAGRTVAVDPDVVPLGSKVYINGTEYVAEDIGGAIKGKRIDVLLPSHEAALQFGVKYTDVSIIK